MPATGVCVTNFRFDKEDENALLCIFSFVSESGLQLKVSLRHALSVYLFCNEVFMKVVHLLM